MLLVDCLRPLPGLRSHQGRNGFPILSRIEQQRDKFSQRRLSPQRALLVSESAEDRQKRRREPSMFGTLLPIKAAWTEKPEESTEAKQHVFSIVRFVVIYSERKRERQQREFQVIF